MIEDSSVVEGLARAIYQAHWRPPEPIWDSASEALRKWVRAQARAALAYLEGIAPDDGDQS